MAAATSTVNRTWYGVNGGQVRRPKENKLKDGTVLYYGALGMSVAGVARPVLGGTNLQAVCTQFTGADANGHVFVRAKVPGVRMTFLTGGNNLSLGVTSITMGANTDIVIQLATDGGGAATSTSAKVVDLLRSNAEISKLIRAEAGGTGASATAAVAQTAVAHVRLLGVATAGQSASGAGADVALNSDVAFMVGWYEVDGELNKVPTHDSYAYLIDDKTCTSDSDGLNFRCPCIVDNGKVYLNLCEAE